MGVYPNQSGLNLSGEAVGFTDVLCPQAGSETVLARVGQKQTFGFVLFTDYRSVVSQGDSGSSWLTVNSLTTTTGPKTSSLHNSS